jgi:hypothetical protein
MKLREVVQVKSQSGNKKMKQTFETIKNGKRKKLIFKWRTLKAYESSDGIGSTWVVTDNKDNLVYGFKTKKFQNGISIIATENYSEGKYKNLTKEIIFELLKSGIKEVYTDDKQSPEMIKVHKKIMRELPYSQVVVRRFDMGTNTVDDDLTNMFSDRLSMFQFIWKDGQINETFENEFPGNMWSSGLVSELQISLNQSEEEMNCDWANKDSINDLIIEAKEKLGEEAVDKMIEKSYDGLADFLYEYTRWEGN